LALPATLSEVGQRGGGLRRILMSHLVQDTCGSEAAEAALARPHAQPQIPPQVVQHPRRDDVGVRAGCLLEVRARDQLALTNE